MKKGIFFIILMIVFSSVIKSQEKALYLIAGQGCPANCAHQFLPHYPVHLFKVKNKKLEKVYDIANGNEYVFKIGQYNAFKKIIIYKSELYIKKKSFIIIDYKNGLRIDTVIRNFGEETFSDFTYYLVYKNEPYIIFEHCKDIIKKRNERFYYGINLTTKQDTIFDNNIIQYIHSEGEQGIAMVESTDDNSEIMKIRTKIINDTPLYYILYPRLYTKDTALFNIPKLNELIKLHPYILWPDKGNEFSVFPLVNENIICINSSIDYDENKLQGRQKLLIYTKQFEKWCNPVFRGIFSNAYRQINDWIVGYEAYSYSLGYYQKIKKYGSIPGKKFRKDITEYGTTFDTRAMEYKLYPEGVLYIYNINTGKYIEWEAIEKGERQGDSEVLYIEDETVYYRINDKIYKAPIINGEKLGQSELLIKDERVPDIHWAFLR